MASANEDVEQSKCGHSHGHEEGHSHSHGQGHGHSHGHGHGHGDHNSMFEDANFGENYLALARQSQLGYDDLFQLAAAAIGVPTATNVLVAGCGGGQELVTFGKIPSQGKRVIVGVDPSAPFLGIARKRVTAEVDKEAAANIHAVHGYVHTLPLPGAPGSDGAVTEPFDAATSMFVMHHAVDDDTPEGKASHLRAIGARLKPGAKLFIVDVNRHPDAAEFRRQVEAAMAYQSLRGVPVSTTHNMFKTMNMCPLVSEERVVELLGANGFTSIVRLYAAFHVAGWVATRV